MQQVLNEIIMCPVLMYTSIIPSDSENTSFCTTIQKFETDMTTLIAKGYNPISIREAYECRKNEKEWRKNPVCVVFLGGYENNYTLAFPVLKRLNIPASIFVATDLVGVRRFVSVENFCPHFDWEQAQEMQQSGLVEIFPMWHAFDCGKPLDEVQNKITQLSCSLPNSDPSLAIAYNDCTYNELCTLNEIGINVCITDCFHITYKSIKIGMIPSISVDYTSDVIDIIDQYRILCKNTLEKDAAKMKEPSYIEASSAILSESIVLPVDRRPFVRNYLRHAFPLSIMQTQNIERAERLVLNEYIDVIYKPAYNWYDYHNHFYSALDCFEYKVMTSDLLAENNINIVEYIINALRLGYYCDTWLDTYYIPGKPGYEHIHMTHGVLIYAYSAENREFFALSYNSKEQYCELRIPIKAIYMACSNSYFDYIALVKNHESTIIEYDLHELCAKLSAYLNSICHDDNKRFSKKSPRQYYNYDATQKYIEEFKKVADNDDYVHLTSLYSFAEHKRIMMWRVKYISNKEKLPVDFDEAYASTIEATERLVNLGIKYNITKRKSICTNMENIMHQLCINEKLAIDELLVCVNPKYSN